jgi:hypothetical protein
MKRIRLLIGGLVACSIALAMVTTLSAQTAQDGIAKVVKIKGSARYMSNTGGNWQPLRSGTLLKPGAIVQTASGSYVDMVLNNASAAWSPLPMASTAGAPPATGLSYQPKSDQDAVRIFENTVLSVDKLTIDQTGVDTVTDTELDLKAGSIMGSVKKLSTASKYEVKVPNGVAGIRGTIYWISAAGQVSVVQGSISYAYVKSDGSVATVTVLAGQYFDPSSGLPPQPWTAPQQQFFMNNTPHAPPNGNGNIHFSQDWTIYYVSPNRPIISQGQTLGGGAG